MANLCNHILLQISSLYTPGNRLGDPKYVVLFWKNLAVLTDHLF